MRRVGWLESYGAAVISTAACVAELPDAMATGAGLAGLVVNWVIPAGGTKSTV
jgi:hypothetical protein